jgi:hypothetical protein
MGEPAGLLVGNFTVLTYDRRGRGDSTDTSPHAAEPEVEDLATLIDDDDRLAPRVAGGVETGSVPQGVRDLCHLPSDGARRGRARDCRPAPKGRPPGRRGVGGSLRVHRVDGSARRSKCPWTSPCGWPSSRRTSVAPRWSGGEDALRRCPLHLRRSGQCGARIAGLGRQRGTAPAFLPPTSGSTPARSRTRTVTTTGAPSSSRLGSHRPPVRERSSSARRRADRRSRGRWVRGNRAC